MKLKRVLAAFLSAALICTGGTVTALAADTQENASPIVPGQAAQPYVMGMEATVVEVMEKTGDSGTNALLVKTTEATPQEIILNISEQTIFMDSQSGMPVTKAALKVGDKVFAYHDMAMTRSLPPQTHAQAILVNLPKTGAPAHLLTAENVTVDPEGNVIITAESGSVLVTIGKDTPISPLSTKNIVKNTDIHMGTRIFAWYDVVALSMPGQAHATKAVILPNIDKSVTIVSEGDIAIGEGKVVNGVTMVPIRVVAEKLGFTVSWDAKTESVILNNGTVKTTVKIGEDLYHMAAAKEGLVGMSAPTSLGAAAYTEKGISWAPAELFNLLLGNKVLSQQGGIIRM